jgi:Na+-translocating ferredoxin:NAD+ oxidoreductase RnfC subunit
VPIGMSLAEVLAMAGGSTVVDAAYIDGGPMMGKLVTSLDAPVTKTTGGLIVLPASHILISRRTRSERSVLEMARTTCEQCLLCTELCPRHIIGHELPPHLIVRSVNYHHFGQPSTLLSALTCSECAICEAWACPVDISPMRLNQMLKVQLRRENARYTGPLQPADPMAEHRLVPVSRLIAKLAISEYNRKAPLDETPRRPARVVLPLKQHAGAPAVPCVKVGDTVQAGQLVAEIAPDTLGARIHASIDGHVESVSDDAITLAAQ